MRPWLAAVIFILIFPFTSVNAQSAPTVEFNDLAVFYKYGEQVTFQARISSDEVVQQVHLFIQPVGEATRVEKTTINQDGEVIFKYSLVNKPLRPFTRVEYWFRVTTASETVTSEKQSFTYSDNRFTWQILEEKGYQVNWIEGDVSFGQAALDAARAGLKSAQSILPAAPPGLVSIYIYTRAGDLQTALQLSQISWVAGHASPDLGVILVSIRPGMDQQVEMDRQLPHEIMHLLAYQAAGGNYERLPSWFLEGIASITELTPNPDYRNALEQAIKNKNLISIASLCATFPREASGAILAYAQSGSFVRFLQQKFGTSGLLELVKLYKNGLGCAEGVEASFGATIEQLESRWRQEALGLDTTTLALTNLAPYLGAGLILLLVPLGYALLAPAAKHSKKTRKGEDGAN